MLKEERQKYIINQINIHNKVLSADLSMKLNVSEDTVRRDLNELTDSGQIIKVHGGAISKSFHFPYSERDIYKKEEKKEIARKAVELIEDGMIVIAGGGTTMIELARLIPGRVYCTFFTISPVVAIELGEHPNLHVHLIGGKLSPDTQILVGAQVIHGGEVIEVVDLALEALDDVGRHAELLAGQVAVDGNRASLADAPVGEQVGQLAGALLAHQEVDRAAAPRQQLLDESLADETCGAGDEILHAGLLLCWDGGGLRLILHQGL